MEFSDKELKIIFTVLEISIQSVEMKKKHKSKNDILALRQMQSVSEKIKKYMEVK